MNLNYGDNWEVASKSVFQYSEIEEASRNCPAGNLLRCLTADDAQELIRDYQASQRGKIRDPKAPLSQLDRDIQKFEQAQRMREK
jgi:hypothetical protein